jgi:thiamine biosynthesis lipoprotein
LSDPEAGLFEQAVLTDMAGAVSSPGALRLSPHAQHILHPSDDSAPLWSSAAVIAQDAALADGLSTAACFLSPEALSACIAALPEVERIVLLDQNGAKHALSGLR